MRGLLEVAFSIDVLENLGDVQQEILHNLTVDFMTVKQIAILRKTSTNAVKKVISKLKEKSLIDDNYNAISGIIDNNSDKGGSPTLSPKKNEYRLHGQNHTIKLLSTSKDYFNFLEKTSKFKEDENSINIYRRKIVIYSNKSFFGSSPDECFESANIYWNNFFMKLQSKLNIKFIDGFNTEIKQFRCHIAKTNDLLAKKVINNKLNYELRDDLGRLRLIIDNSKGLFEFEAVEPDLCQDDMNKIKEFQDDLINHESLKPSEITKIINSLLLLQSNTVKAQTKTDEINEYNSLIMREVLREIEKIKVDMNFRSV